MGYCLGLKFLGYCSDYYLTQYSVYNLGAGIATLSIIFAISQLLTPLYRFRISLRPKLSKFSYLLFGLNILCLLIGAILPLIPGKALPLIGYAIFWEIIAALFFLSFLLFILLATERPIKRVNERNIERVYGVCVAMIAERERQHQALAKELRYFIHKIVNLSHSKNEKVRYYSNNLLGVLADPEFCRLIALREPKTLQDILLAFKNSEIQPINIFLVKEVINSSLSSNDSILVREWNSKGIGVINNGEGIITKLILEDYSLIGRYQLLYQDSPQEREPYIFANNYAVFFEKVLDTYFQDVENLLFYSGDIYEGMKNISVCLSKPKNKSNWRIVFWVHTLNRLIRAKEREILNSYNNKIPDIPLDERGKYGNPLLVKEENIFGFIAKGTYELLEVISRYFKDEDGSDKRRVLKHVYIVIKYGFLNGEANSKVLNALEERVQLLIKEEIEENLKGYYPMMIEVFFHLWGDEIFSKSIEKTKFQKEVLKMIAEKLPDFVKGFIYAYPKNTSPDTLDKNKIQAREILKDMLPKNMSYDSTKNVLTYFHALGRDYSEIDLNKFIETGKITPVYYEN